jgi:hypothetical protein
LTRHETISFSNRILFDGDSEMLGHFALYATSEEEGTNFVTGERVVTDLPFYVFIPVVCWAPVDLDPREMVTPGSSNR